MLEDRVASASDGARLEAHHLQRARGESFPRTSGHRGRVAAQDPPSAAEKRRAHRVAASMPVLVYGHSAHAPFAEPAITANVSRTGGLVGPVTNVIRFQKLVVTNLQKPTKMLSAAWLDSSVTKTATIL